MKPRSLVALVLLAVTVLPACSIGCLLKPSTDFDAKAIPNAPDYSSDAAWAALPDKEDGADRVPKGDTNAQASAPADVFFLHPTTWFSRKKWNDTLKGKASNELIDQMIMTNQASIFNGCCRVFAPRYRQATLGAFYADKVDAKKAFDVAYQDVDRAFTHFLKTHNKARPFVLASHSQGSMHAMRLLERIDADPNLRKRLVVAYIPGFAHPMSRYKTVYKHLKPCASASQVQCIAAWDTYKKGAKVEGHEPHVYWKGAKLVTVDMDQPRQCTNPVSWRADKKRTKAEDHLGAVEVINKGKPVKFSDLLFSDDPPGLKVVGLKPPKRKLLTAQCDKQALRVPDMEDKYPVIETQSGNYHMMDYELFWQDIRVNAMLRVRTWVGSNTPAATPDKPIVPEDPSKAPSTSPQIKTTTAPTITPSPSSP